MSLNIAILCDGLFPEFLGGIQKHSALMAHHLAELGLIVDVYTPRNRNAVEDPFAEKKFSIIPVPSPQRKRCPGHYFVERYQYSRHVAEALRRRHHKHDVIYGQAFSGWAWSREASGHDSKAPLVSNFHGLNMFQAQPNLSGRVSAAVLRRMARDVLRRSDYCQSLGGKLTKIITDNTHSSNKLFECGIGIESDFEAEDTSTSTSQSRVFTFVGRHERLKGILELHSVITTNEWPYDVSFRFIGPIPEQSRLRHPQVTYAGEIRDTNSIRRHLAESDVLICPSFSEGMPTVILEAMACRCAIIATDVGAVECQVDKDNGWLIPPGDIRSLKSAIQSALSIDQQTLFAMKTVSHSRYRERFTWEAIARQMRSQFQAICQ